MAHETMRAVIMLGKGEPDVLTVADVPAPEPGPGQIRVKVASSGVNRADLLQRRGRYPVPPGVPDNIPGLEYAGVVESVGPGVSAWEAGDAVMGITGGAGYAEFVVVHEREAVRAPAGMDPVTAGAIPEVFLTAFDAIFLQMNLRAGESVLIHAVGGGVGTAAVQLARWAGCETLGTSRTLEKLRGARELGLEHGILGGENDWREAVMDITGGRGVDVVLDLVGGPYLADNVRALATGGRIVTVGVTGGRSADLDLRGLMARRGSITGTVLRARPLEEKGALANEFSRRVVRGFETEDLKPVIDHIFPAEDAAESHRRMESNVNFGKILLSW